MAPQSISNDAQSSSRRLRSRSLSRRSRRTKATDEGDGEQHAVGRGEFQEQVRRPQLQPQLRQEQRRAEEKQRKGDEARRVHQPRSTTTAEP